MKDTEGVPRDCLVLEDKVPTGEGEVKSKILGGTSLEYNSEAGPLKYLVGTEQGYILMANKKKTIDIQQRFGYDQVAGVDCGKHHGPVYSLWRNPDHQKYFLSVGDWCAKIWSEEQKSPIMQTRYHQAYLTDGCWSKTRCGLFFLTRIDGFLDVWDFYYRQNEVAYSQKISDSPLTSIEVNADMAAIGDAEGTVSIMKLCKPLYEKAPNEKDVMFQILERETRREKTLELSKKKEAEKKPPKKEKDVEAAAKAKEEEVKEHLEKIEENFFKKVSVHEDISEIKARGELSKQAAVEQEAAAAMANTGKSLKTESLEEGKSYKFKIDGKDYAFTVEAGGNIVGNEINGNCTAGNVIFQVGGIDYEGTFTS